MISIITPYFAAGATILETAESLFSQTLAFSEWIIVDDGSHGDVSGNVLEELVSKDGRIRVIKHDKNEGLPTARNTGINNSSGDFLFFLDADDLVDPTYLEKAYLVLSQYEDLSFVNSYVVGFEAQSYYWTGGFYEGELFLKENRNTSCFMAKRQAFEHILFNQKMTEGCEDWEFWLNAASKGLKGYTIPEFLFYYRRTVKNKWETLKDEQSLTAIRKELSDKYTPLLAGRFPIFRKPVYNFGYIAPAIELITTESLGRDKHIMCVFPWLEVGGADQFNINLLKGLKSKGWSFTILTTMESEHPWESKFRELTVDIFHLTNYSLEEGFSAVLDYFIQSRNPDLLFISHSKYAYYALPHLKMKFPKLPVVDYTHCVEANWYNGGYPCFSAKFSALIDLSFVTSENLKNWCIDNGAVAEKVKVCYIGVDSKEIKRDPAVRRQLREQLSFPENLPVIMYVARLTEQKQPKLLVHVLHQLKNRGINFKCVIVGDGPEKANLFKLVDKLDLKNDILYFGNQPNEAVLHYMNAADLFFLPSKYEGIALSIYEAMAKELAIVAADVGGQSELVNKECGFLVVNDDESLEVYVNILSKVLSQPEIIKELGQKGRKNIEENFDLAMVVEMMHSYFTNIVTSIPNAQVKCNNDEYLLLLNRLLSLEREVAVNQELLGSRIVKIVSKHSSHIIKLKKIYSKLKGVVQR